MYKSVIWDLDGTLLNTAEGVEYAVKYTIKELGLRLLDEKIIKKFVGPPMQLSFKKFYEMDDVEALRCANLFRKNYKEHSLLKASLYKNVEEVMKWLLNKGYRIAIATNKSHENAIEIIEYFNLDKYCDCILGSDMEGKLTKKDIIQQCLKTLDVSADKAIYIGDSEFDYEGAKSVGMDFIGVTYGYGFVIGGEYPFKTINMLAELFDIL